MYGIKYSAVVIKCIKYHIKEGGVKMKHESMLTKHFRVVLLMVGILMTLICCFSSSAKAAKEEDVIDKEVNWLKLNQDKSVSRYQSPYITALAITASKEGVDMPSAEINSIKLYKNINDTKTECYSYNAYETLEIVVDSTISNIDAEHQYFIKKANGSVLTSKNNGLLRWNTENCQPGDYSVIVQVKDKNSGSIVARKEKQFVINPYFKVFTVNLSTDPENVRINNPCTINVQSALVSDSNCDKTLTFKTSVIDAGTVIKEETKTIQSKSGEQLTKAKVITFTPDVTVSKDYIIKIEVFDGITKITQSETTFKVLPPLPPTKIDAGQGLSKSVLHPGQDSVTAQFKLTGEGTTEIPQRNPIDLIICIDDSGSMEWGNADGSTTKPWRIDFAKDASKRVIDLLQKDDRGAVVEFAGSKSIWIQQDLTEDKELIKKSISQTPASPWNGTDIAGAISKSIDILNQKSSTDRDKIIILISDGASDTSTINISNTAKEKGYKIYTIALGDAADRNLMSTISEMTQGKYVYSPTMEQLDAMMNILAGEIFDIAGKNIVIETTIPANGMAVDTSKIVPMPTNVTKTTDGAINLKWTFDRFIMEEEKVFEIKYSGTDLPSDTEVILTQSTKLMYQDRNGTTITEKLPDLKISVSKYMLELKVKTDKGNYTANEKVNITNTATNLTDYPATLTAKVEIIDTDGNCVKTITEKKLGTWNANETKTLDFSWNTGSTMASTYMARITWSEGKKTISVAEASFDITPQIMGALGNLKLQDKIIYGKDNVVLNYNINNTGNTKLDKITTRIKIVDTSNENVLETITDVLSLDVSSTYDGKQIWTHETLKPGSYMVVLDVIFPNGKEVPLASSSFTVGEISLPTSILTDKKDYSTDDIVNITISTKNLTSKEISLDGRVFIIDTNGTVIKKYDKITNMPWKTSESKNFEYVWNTDKAPIGNYNVRIVWMRDGINVSSADACFNVIDDKNIGCTINTDKKKYLSGEKVNLKSNVMNYSQSYVHNNLLVKTKITNAKGEIIWNLDNSISKLLTEAQSSIKNIWNIPENLSVQYTATIEVYNSKGNLIASSSTAFEIIKKVMAVSGSLEVQNKDISSTDDVIFKYKITNIGNVKLDNVTTRITILDAATGSVLDTIEDLISIDTSSSYSDKKIWVHKPLDLGDYIVNIDVVLPNGRKVTVAKDSFTVVRLNLLVIDAFKYTLFSGDTANELQMNLYKGNINGDVHTNKYFKYAGTSLNINGVLSSAQNINTNGCVIQFNKLETNSPIYKIPNVAKDIKTIASKDGNTRDNSLTINEYRNGLSFTKSEVSEDCINISGTSLNTKGYIYAKNSITFNLDSIKSTAPNGIVICSANSDITINTSNANLKGIIYAPNGTVYINTNNFRLEGRIIAKRIVVQSTSFEVSSTGKDLDLMDTSKMK